jgi:hypothetical protein
MATKLSKVSGFRPKVYNLKDNSDLSGKTIVINHIEFQEGGEYGLFCIMNCKPYDKVGLLGEEIVITTGAKDVTDRLLPLREAINNGEEIEGTLSKIGRKWFID